MLFVLIRQMFRAALGLGLYGQNSFQGRTRKSSETTGMLERSQPVRLPIDVQQREHALCLFPRMSSGFQKAFQEPDGRAAKLLELLFEQTTPFGQIAWRQVLAQLALLWVAKAKNLVL